MKINAYTMISLIAIAVIVVAAASFTGDLSFELTAGVNVHPADAKPPVQTQQSHLVSSARRSEDRSSERRVESLVGLLVEHGYQVVDLTGASGSEALEWDENVITISASISDGRRPNASLPAGSNALYIITDPAPFALALESPLAQFKLEAGRRATARLAFHVDDRSQAHANSGMAANHADDLSVWRHR